MWAIIWMKRWPALFGALGVATFLLSLTFRDFGQVPYLLILLGMSGEGLKRQDRREKRLLDRLARGDIEGVLARRQIMASSVAAVALTSVSLVTLTASYFGVVTVSVAVALSCLAGVILGAAVMMLAEWRAAR